MSTISYGSSLSGLAKDQYQPTLLCSGKMYYYGRKIEYNSNQKRGCNRKEPEREEMVNYNCTEILEG